MPTDESKSICALVVDDDPDIRVFVGRGLSTLRDTRSWFH
jgi:hypothetical protein